MHDVACSKISDNILETVHNRETVSYNGALTGIVRCLSNGTNISDLQWL